MITQPDPRQANYNHQPGNMTNSYITIGDDDPFLTGKFCDASTKQFNFMPNSYNPSKIHNHNSSISLSKNSDMQYYGKKI